MPLIFFALFLAGCTSVPYPRDTMVGPYDITLTSHQEALGIRPR